MAAMEDLELLRAAMAVALADGELTRSEKGVLQGLANRIGIGQASFDAMMEVAERDDSVADNVLIRSRDHAKAALQLLVAQARIDGRVTDAERDILVRIAAALTITGADFEAVYTAGIQQADRIRRSRGTS